MIRWRAAADEGHVQEALSRGERRDVKKNTEDNEQRATSNEQRAKNNE
jgi:hypothetical protein